MSKTQSNPQLDMQIKPDVYEKLGAFFLGREFDLASGESKDDLVLYDSKDLTTHAVVVGMTGSGKTGLCISMLEEAAIDNVPALVIDPKGDISNLMLTFPGLSATEFRPWINEDDARIKGITPDEYASKQAELWKDGLASWGQDGERIAKLKEAADVTVYTPGSDAGIPLSVLSSFDPPSETVMSDGDMLRERIETTVTSLLTMLGLDVDPLQSREHILVANIVAGFWRDGKSVSMADLIHAIQNPSFDRVGVMDLESFFPSKDRFSLSNRLNNLLASPGFESWMSGAPMDVDKLLYGPNGEPRIAICSIAHLSDSERQFFVSLLLNQAIGWMRSKSGTTSLRALLYIDEIFGYMPPVANPPTKQPLLTLLKQARAYGLGLVLATQNPVDLDYKGLSNTGSWFIGRLQTERDKMRVLEGLEGAAAGGTFDRGKMEQILAGLGKRVFLLHNVHEPEPVVFQTRWALSYLRGPLTRSQIKVLMADRKNARSDEPVTVATEPNRVAVKPKAVAASRPVVPPDIDQLFVRPRADASTVEYVPHVLASATVSYVDTRRGIQHQDSILRYAEIKDGPRPVDWSTGTDVNTDEIAKKPVDGAAWDSLPSDATQARNYSSWGKQLSDDLYRDRVLETLAYEPAKVYSLPGESERDFRIRIGDVLREQRDEAVVNLREKYKRKIETATERLRKAEQKVEKEEEQASTTKMQSYVSIGTTVLSALLGKKTLSSSTVSKASTAVRGFSRSTKEQQDVERALEDVEARQNDLEEIERMLEDDINDIEMTLNPKTVEFDVIQTKPRRADVEIHYTVLAWVPA